MARDVVQFHQGKQCRKREREVPLGWVRDRTCSQRAPDTFASISERQRQCRDPVVFDI